MLTGTGESTSLLNGGGRGAEDTPILQRLRQSYKTSQADRLLGSVCFKFMR